MGLSEELEGIAGVAAEYADRGEEVAAVLACEPAAGGRVYLCAFQVGEDNRSWLALDEAGRPIGERALVRGAASIAAMCEVAVETAGGGELEELRARLVALRLRENPPGIDEAEEAALALERAVGVVPPLASPGYLDELGAATRRLELALGNGLGSPFAVAMQQATPAIEALVTEVESSYKRPLT